MTTGTAIYDVDQLAALYRVTPETIRRMCRCGLHGFFRVGTGGKTQYRFTEQHVQAYIALNESAGRK